MEEVIGFLQSIYPFSNELIAHLFTIIRSKELEKHEILLREGDVCKNIYFIRKGLIRCYYMKEEKEVNAWFLKENDTIVAVDSFYDQVPTKEYIQSLEPCELYYIGYNQLGYIFKNYIEFNFVGRILTQKYLRLWNRQLQYLRMHTAIERCEDFLKNEQGLLGRVPDYHIASYLGMDKGTFSRVKGKLI